MTTLSKVAEILLDQNGLGYLTPDELLGLATLSENEEALQNLLKTDRTVSGKIHAALLDYTAARAKEAPVYAEASRYLSQFPLHREAMFWKEDTSQYHPAAFALARPLAEAQKLAQGSSSSDRMPIVVLGADDASLEFLLAQGAVTLMDPDHDLLQQAMESVSPFLRGGLKLVQDDLCGGELDQVVRVCREIIGRANSKEDAMAEVVRFLKSKSSITGPMRLNLPPDWGLLYSHKMLDRVQTHLINAVEESMGARWPDFRWMSHWKVSASGFKARKLVFRQVRSVLALTDRQKRVATFSHAEAPRIVRRGMPHAMVDPPNQQDAHNLALLAPRRHGLGLLGTTYRQQDRPPYMEQYGLHSFAPARGVFRSFTTTRTSLLIAK